MSDNAVNEIEEQKKTVELHSGGTQMSRTTTDTKPEHAQATAIVYVHGLSVLCPNYSNKTTDIAFVKEDHTGVRIKVFKGGCREFWSHNCSREEKTRIEIKKSRPVDGGKFYEEGKLYDEDFAWMPDLNKWHDQTGIGIQENAKDHLSAKLELSDAIFYTHIKSAHKSKLTSDSDREKDLGRVGRVLGADIICDNQDTDVTINIESSGGTVISKSLPKDGAPYFIVVYTEAESEGDHLHHVYHHIVEVDSRQPRYKFKFDQEEKLWHLCGGGEKITEYACQTIPAGEGPLPSLP